MRRHAIFAAAVLAVASIAEAAYQTPFQLSLHNESGEPWLSRPWNEPLDADATGNLVFQSLAGLAQMAPNSKYTNGHSIVRATIPAGTLLYHGSFTGKIPSRDWIAFDPEHSFLFSIGSLGTLYTLMTTRELRFVYFDGCSANKLRGEMDTQDILIFGKAGWSKGNWTYDEFARINSGCAWAEQYGIDGFIRMQLDFEIMYCNFSQGLEVVSVVTTLNGLPGKPYLEQHGNVRMPDESNAPSDVRPPPIATYHGLSTESLSPYTSHTLGLSAPPSPAPRLPPLVPPAGWNGTFPVTLFEARHTGTWHNAFPGDSRMRTDPSTLISFFDPALRSLVAARRTQARQDYRAGNISAADIATVQRDIAEVMARGDRLESKSGVDWHSLARVVQERFADRLPFVRHLLHQPTANVSARGGAVRRQLIVSLIPYMPKEDVGTPAWFADIADRCAAGFTSRLPVDRFTKQERLLYTAVNEVLHEICRVYTEAWVDAFSMEQQGEHVARELLGKWRVAFDALIQWLDWPMWVQCEPACGVDEFCEVPQGRFPVSDDHTPRCIPINFESLT